MPSSLGFSPVKFVLYSLCLLYFVYQMHNSVVKLLEPTVVTTSRVEERPRIKLPSVTVCQWKNMEREEMNLAKDYEGLMEVEDFVTHVYL